LEVNQKVSARKVESGVDVERLRGQVELLADIGEKVGVGLIDLATKTGANTSKQVFFRASNVAGSRLHQGVYAAGKFIGFNFKPYQAVNIAKGIGNVAKVLGPILAVGLLAMDVYAMTQEDERANKLAEARHEITSQFITIAKDLESQIEVRLGEFEAKIYGEIEQRITVARCQEEDTISTSNKSVAQLTKVRKDLERVLDNIIRATND